MIDRPVDDEAIADAAACGASEIVYCPQGVPPAALAGLTMGYHEIEEPVSEPAAVIQVSIVADRLAGLGLTQDQIDAVTAS